ncbi:MAG: TIGR01440 family protein [Oscillospiraceae bacterium]
MENQVKQSNNVGNIIEIEKEFNLNELKAQAEEAINELFKIANPKRGEIFIIGCSTSEITGHTIGTYSSLQVAQALFDGIYPLCEKHGVFLAAQCCEHLNRAIIIEKNCAEKYNLEQVNVVPQPKAGGSFSSVCYASFKNAVAVETIKAHCGIDIGGTLIGMHLKNVAVPVRLDIKSIGKASIICARTRAKFVGGQRAFYNDLLL